MNMNHFPEIFIFSVAITLFTLSTTRCNPVGSTVQSKLDEHPTIHHDGNAVDYSNTVSVTEGSKCDLVEYELKDVIILNNNHLFLKSWNITIHSSEYQMKNGRIYTCISFQPKMEKLSALNCLEKFEYEEDEFHILPNKSAIVGRNIVPEGEYELSGNYLLTCAPDDDAPSDDAPSTGLTLKEVSIYVGQVGSLISVISLTLHLFTFFFVPSLRNLPGYNLASLSLAFLLAYSWVLIGQIPQVLGVYCVMSAVLQQNCFLAAFFCMNVLAFDVWRTLKLATERLVVGSRNSRKRQFLWYSLYAWGVPLVITTISVLVDNSPNAPAIIKPEYGKFDVCWMYNRTAKAVFFAVPAFTLLLVNAVFFVLSSWMISSNTMKLTKDQSKQNVKLNYVLYVRLGIMMGLTWLVGIIAIIARVEWLWFIFDLLNSLQGLFLFLLFTCTKKVFRQLSAKSSIFTLHSAKQTTLTSNTSSVLSKIDSNGVKLTENSMI